MKCKQKRKIKNGKKELLKVYIEAFIISFSALVLLIIFGIWYMQEHRMNDSLYRYISMEEDEAQDICIYEQKGGWNLSSDSGSTEISISDEQKKALMTAFHEQQIFIFSPFWDNNLFWHYDLVIQYRNCKIGVDTKKWVGYVMYTNQMNKCHFSLSSEQQEILTGIIEQDKS